MMEGEAEVIVTTNDAKFPHEPLDEDELSLDELARRQGVRPVRNVHDMARPHVFESDEELEEFLAHITASRHADLA
jgi:hypothetical protein